MVKKRREHSLTGRIDVRLMGEAFKAVKRNRGAAGIDKVSVKMFEANLAENLAALMRDLKKGTFQPKPLRRVSDLLTWGHRHFRHARLPGHRKAQA